MFVLIAVELFQNSVIFGEDWIVHVDESPEDVRAGAPGRHNELP